ncbi:hypothetical protein CXG81DRAFT_17952 [Caulochytrium protostelioides]|uniref:MRPL25 domain-containing protein n=1 Tax=Caulochytrium protostelioides TaxID=1555241 RepID=A0A4P9XAH3_9FUNG|nr:hypothetical protein CXG81DRAFT_17952 [Caulochytrium protostelioides]|eukprot:RKP02357.1 hypothetical protein CXG81DRAFT_17952 [Caulochytrium protostelioides]
MSAAAAAAAPRGLRFPRVMPGDWQLAQLTFGLPHRAAARTAESAAARAAAAAAGPGRRPAAATAAEAAAQRALRYAPTRFRVEQLTDLRHLCAIGQIDAAAVLGAETLAHLDAAAAAGRARPRNPKGHASDVAKLLRAQKVRANMAGMDARLASWREAKARTKYAAVKVLPM